MDGLTHISATEAKQCFGALIDGAQHAPVIIERQKRAIAALISIAQYERLTRLNIKEFQDFRLNVASKAEKRGLNQGKLDELLSDGA